VPEPIPKLPDSFRMQLRLIPAVQRMSLLQDTRSG
jgi:hypothetical protein